MIGLIYKNLKMGQGIVTLWNFLLMIIGAAILGLIIPWEMFFIYISFGLSGGIGAIVLGYMYKDDDSNWQKLEATMPFTSRQIIFSKYASYAILFIPASIMNFAYAATNYLNGTLMAACECYYCVCAGICGCVLYMVYNVFFGVVLYFFVMGAVTIPFHILLSPVKNEIAFFIGMIMVVLLLVSMVGLLTVFDFSSLGNTILRIGVAVVVYVGSYFVSLRLYRKKSF